jgi:hypothetical protein
VEGGTDSPSPSWGEGLFAGSSPVVDANDRCVGQVRCAVGRWNRHRVPKRRLLNTTRRGTTQKITRNI